ncbi:hypothetical protein I862_02740 [endosymbiont of Acanthamoeba sp. UWC8]|uniref:hypothetical protein n=1 Tax=endosymbiont of Acanthamoeba sp. UWC8 TaxID=86106 RepID=UPI0004D14ECF|nr:hypothetical protein [endosymbiont of Acanthamoeba sp. UWC8]AIF81111.1 hypothetical protein I862_02740 [endosymbiont of Acanthamoeba sp. UWC8]
MKEIFEQNLDLEARTARILGESENDPTIAFKNTFAYMQEVADSAEKFAVVFSTMRELYKNIPVQNVSEQVEAASSVLDFANNYKGDNREAIGQNILEFTNSLDENIKQHARIKDDFEALKLSGNKKPVSPIRIELGQVKKVDNTKSRAFLEAAKEVADKMQSINESLSDGINTKPSPEVDSNARQQTTEPGLAIAEKARVTVDSILEAATPDKPISQQAVEQSVNDKGSNIREQGTTTPEVPQAGTKINAGEEIAKAYQEAGIERKSVDQLVKEQEERLKSRGESAKNIEDMPPPLPPRDAVEGVTPTLSQLDAANGKDSNTSEQGTTAPEAPQISAETNAEEAKRVIRESGKSIADRKAALEEEVKNNQAKNANKIDAEQEIRELRAAAGEEPLSLAQRRDALEKAFKNQSENINKINAKEEIAKAHQEAGTEPKSVAQLAKEQEERLKSREESAGNIEDRPLPPIPEDENSSRDLASEAQIQGAPPATKDELQAKTEGMEETVIPQLAESNPNNNISDIPTSAAQEQQQRRAVPNKPLPPTPEQAAQQQQADQQKRIVPNKPLPPTPEQAVQDQKPGSNQVDKIDQAQEQTIQNQDAQAQQENDGKPKKRGFLSRFGDALKDEFTPSNKTMMMIWAGLLIAAMLFFPPAVLPLVIFGAAAAGTVAANKAAKVFNSPVGHSIAKAVSAPMGMFGDLVNGLLKGTAALGAIVATPFTDKTLAENVKAATGALPELGSFTKAALTTGGVNQPNNSGSMQKANTANSKTTDTAKRNDGKGQESKKEDKEATTAAVEWKGAASPSTDKKVISTEQEQQPISPPVPPRPTQAELEAAKASPAAGQQQPTPEPVPAPQQQQATVTTPEVGHNNQGNGLKNLNIQDQQEVQKLARSMSSPNLTSKSHNVTHESQQERLKRNASASDVKKGMTI